MGNEFYSKIVEYYDYIFPLSNLQVEFVLNNFPEQQSRILEVGCANGKLTNALRQYEISGVDLEDDFIEIARNRFPELSFQTLNMLKINTLQQKYDGVICFGNTLVHISEKDVDQFLQGVFERLESGGKVLLQIVNYDNILDHALAALPLLDNEEITFKRTYIKGEKFIFRGELTVKTEGKTLSSEIELFPLRKMKLVSLLEKNGFKNTHSYGDFKMNCWDNTSPATVIVAEK